MLIPPHSDSSTQHMTQENVDGWWRRDGIEGPERTPSVKAGTVAMRRAAARTGESKWCGPVQPPRDTRGDSLCSKKNQTVHVSEEKGANMILVWGRTLESALKSWTRTTGMSDFPP